MTCITCGSPRLDIIRVEGPDGRVTRRWVCSEYGQLHGPVYPVRQSSEFTTTTTKGEA